MRSKESDEKQRGTFIFSRSFLLRTAPHYLNAWNRLLLESSRLHSSRPPFSWQSNAWRRYSPRPREPVSRRHEWGHCTEMPQTAPEFSILRFPRGGIPLQEANGDVPLDGVAFSRLGWLWWGRISIELLEWGRKFSDLWVKQGFKMGRFSVKKIRKLLFIKFNNRLALTAFWWWVPAALHSVLETTLTR